jgi:predicted methyltransferase
MSQQQGAVVNVAPQENIQYRRAQMLSEMEQKRLLEDQARVMNHQKQMQIDQVMRRPDMQELHREAMRKMQADVAKKA